MNLSFDQAVSYYDQTRSEPDWVMDAVADAFIRETRATRDSKILEVGIGTGRIALPLLEHGLRIVGIDLSRAMMSGLHPKIAGRDFSVALAQSDAARVPFADESFDTVYGVHVYHLVDGWRSALDDARRVLKGGGALLVSFHYRSSQSPNRKIRQKLGALVRERGFDTARPGAKSDKEIQRELKKWNGNLRVVQAARWKEFSVPARVLDEVEARIYSDVWLIPPDVHADLMPRLREWARKEFGDLSQPVEADAEFNWLIARKIMPQAPTRAAPAQTPFLPARRRSPPR